MIACYGMLHAGSVFSIRFVAVDVYVNMQMSIRMRTGRLSVGSCFYWKLRRDATADGHALPGLSFV